jgi:katanin p80 WD40 repeat-containing subunit B1
MKKRNQKLCIYEIYTLNTADLVTTPGAKVNCARFSPLTHHLFASGDDKNQICIYRMGQNKPIQSFSSSSVASSAQVEVSAICFGPTEEELFSGSNRGIINIWDVVTCKCNTLHHNYRILDLEGPFGFSERFGCLPK